MASVDLHSASLSLASTHINFNLDERNPVIHHSSNTIYSPDLRQCILVSLLLLSPTSRRCVPSHTVSVYSLPHSRSVLCKCQSPLSTLYHLGDDER